MSPRAAYVWCAAVLVAAVAAAYSVSARGPFEYDDTPSIVENPTVQHPHPWWQAFEPPHGALTVSGRPLLNASFALDHALGAHGTFGYHLTNVAIHALAALALFGLVRFTLERHRRSERCRNDATLLAGLIAGIWALHPLQTESVSYLAQRAESLMGLAVLASLWAFAAGRAWLAIAACFAAVFIKESAAMIPLVALLYDRAFLAGSFQAAWKRRWPTYLGLALSWIPLACLIAANGGNRGGSIGMGVPVSWARHLSEQAVAVLHYCRLAVWPHPLVFDYGPLDGLGTVGLGLAAVAVCLLLALVAGALARGAAPWGFLGAWFFLWLAPSSLPPGTTQQIVEHRMYLPLAAIAAAVVCLLAARGRKAALVGGGLVAAGLFAGTVARNATYRSALALWQETAAERPNNARAHCGLGAALVDLRRYDRAESEYRRAAALDPTLFEAQASLGEVLTREQHYADALPPLERALALRPHSSMAQLNYAVALDRSGRTAEALAHYDVAANAVGDVHRAEACTDLGEALLRLGHPDAALAPLQDALGLDAGRAETHYPLANALLQTGHLPEALGEYQRALDGGLGYAELPYNYGNALAAAGRYDDAARQYAEAIRRDPGYAEAHDNRGNALAMLERWPEAAAEYSEALRLKPDLANAQANLALARSHLR